MSDQSNFFAGPYLDRQADARDAQDWREAALADSQTVYVVSRGTTHLIHDEKERGVVFLRREDVLVREMREASWILLGQFRGARCVLIQDDMEVEYLIPSGMQFQELRPIAGSLDEQEAALLAYARALSVWRMRARYCGACGSPTITRSAGHVQQCANEDCAQEFFPRIDPAIIVLVTDGERVLLGRQSSWPPGRYSTIAGFVEPGESLEDAVAREVYEETGVKILSARYQSSQPWPFPSSLMLGFHATAEPGSAIRLNGELEDARWFTRDELAAEGVMPISYSISYRLISQWLRMTDPQ